MVADEHFGGGGVHHAVTVRRDADSFSPASPRKLTCVQLAATPLVTTVKFGGAAPRGSGCGGRHTPGAHAVGSG